MANGALQPAVVDVPIGTLNTLPPDHAGPTGRMIALYNAIIAHHNDDGQKKISVDPRPGFSSLSDELRNSTTGLVEAGTWASPTFLSALGDQLLSICTNRPRVWNGSAWTNYGNTRVVTQKLSQSVLHASNGTIAAPDQAYLAGVTCSVWTEQEFVTDDGDTELNTTAFVGFRSDDGAWVNVPQAINGATEATATFQLAKVVTDGSRFWVFFNAESSGHKIGVHVYDTNGVRLAADLTYVRIDPASPGYWDVHGSVLTGVLLAQQNSVGVDPGDDLGIRISRFTYAGPSDIDVETVSTTAAHCQGPVAWLTNDLTGTSEYLATLGPAEGDGGRLWAYEIDDDLAISHEYDVNIFPTLLPDSITGWAVENGTPGQRDVFISWSEMAFQYNFGGPQYDPALRFTKTVKRTRAGVTTTIRQTNSVIQQSRAFAINSEYYAYTYYESGSGQLLPLEVEDYECADGDFFVGSRIQTLEFDNGGTTGAPVSVLSLPSGISVYSSMSTKNIDGGGTADKVEQVSTPIAGIEGLPNGTQVLKWTFKNALFPTGNYGGALMDVDGSSIASANFSWDVLAYGSSTIAYTSIVSRNGGTVVTGNFTTVGTVEILSTTHYPISDLADLIPADVESLFVNGNITIAGASNGGNNGTFTILRLARTPTPFANNAISGVWVVTTTQVTEPSTAATASISPAEPYRWGFGSPTLPFGDIDIGAFLQVTGAANAGNNNADGFEITDGTSLAVFTVGADAAGTVAEIFDPSALPDVSIRVQASLTPYTIQVAAVDFDYTYIGALLTIQSDQPGTAGVYTITDVIGPHTAIIAPTDGTNTHRSESFDSGDGIFIQRNGNVQPQTQPTWFVTPLTGSQPQVGAFEKGLAYADWRYDANGGESGGGLNHYRFALSSTSNPFGTIRQVVLPFRVGTFTQVSIATVGATQLDIANAALASTVGLKIFQSQGRGEGTGDAGKLLLPGLLAAEFTNSGFAENNFNVGPEAPFVIEQDEDNNAFGLTPQATYVYQVTAARTLENGDTVRSLPSSPITMTMTEDNNVLVIGGRLIKPLNSAGLPVTNHYGVTNHATVTYEIWRSVVVDGVPSTQLHLITNPGSPNALYSGTGTGSGFSFPDENTWNYRDENPDGGIRATEVIYAGQLGQGIAPHFPFPAFSHATTWANRRWVVGYDGAVWMSAELVEGEDPWTFPGFRYPFPPEDPAVCVVGFENFLFMLCAKSIWRIPFVQLPNATLTSGQMPTPIRLPFSMGCSGFAVAMADAVAYSSSVNDGRQVWVVTRNLANNYLSEPIETEFESPVSAMSVDGQQRLLVAAGDTHLKVFDPVAREWSPWVMPTAPDLVTSYQGQPTYQDSGFVLQQSDSAIVDTRDETETPVALDVTFANLSFAQVRAVKRLWEVQIVGVRNGAVNINAEISYPDDTGSTPTIFGPEFVTADADPVLYAINPAEEDATSFRIRVFGSYEDLESNGRCFSLEMLSCEVGLDSSQGLRKLPNGFRLVGTPDD